MSRCRVPRSGSVAVWVSHAALNAVGVTQAQTHEQAETSDTIVTKTGHPLRFTYLQAGVAQLSTDCLEQRALS